MQEWLWAGSSAGEHTFACRLCAWACVFQVHVLAFTSIAGSREDSDLVHMRCVMVPAVAPSYKVLADLRKVCDSMANRKTPMSLCACTMQPVGMLLGVPLRVRIAGAVRSA